MSQINDEHLPAYEQLYLGFMEEIKSVIHMVNDVYSVKIDTLLSSVIDLSQKLMLFVS